MIFSCRSNSGQAIVLRYYLHRPDDRIAELFTMELSGQGSQTGRNK